jgi:hypothetical protein
MRVDQAGDNGIVGRARRLLDPNTMGAYAPPRCSLVAIAAQPQANRMVAVSRPIDVATQPQTSCRGCSAAN